MSRKHWSDLFLIVAAVSLALAFVVNDTGRLIALVAVLGFVIAGARVRRRMV